MARSYAAVDIDFILAIELGIPECQSVVDILMKLGYGVIVSPIVESDLYDISVGAKNPISKSTAVKAYQDISPFGFFTPGLTPMQVCLSRTAAEKFFEESILSGWNKNDYLAVTEASVLEARVLLTNRRSMTDGEKSILDDAMRDCHLERVKIFNSDDFDP